MISPVFTTRPSSKAAGAYQHACFSFYELNELLQQEVSRSSYGAHRGTQCGRNYRAVRRVVYRCSSVSSACGAHRPEDEGGTALTERTAGRRSARSRFRRDCSRRTRSDASRRPFVVEVAGRRRSSRQKVPTYGAGSAVVRRRARASVRVPGGAYCCGMPPQKFCCGGTNCCGMNGCCGGWPNWPGG